jgi:hypothetical protein
VNLLPRSELEQRERAALARRWLVVVVVAVLAIAAVSAGAYALNLAASQRLAGENSRTSDLLSQLGDLSDVSKIRATQNNLEAYRAEAMGTDVAWAPVYAKLSKLVPDSAQITGWDLTTGALPAAGEPSEQTGVEGTLTATSATAIDIVALVRAMRTVDGVIDADGTELSRDTGESDAAGAYTYTVTVTLDQSAYSGDFVEKREK